MQESTRALQISNDVMMGRLFGGNRSTAGTVSSQQESSVSSAGEASRPTFMEMSEPPGSYSSFSGLSESDDDGSSEPSPSLRPHKRRRT